MGEEDGEGLVAETGVTRRARALEGRRHCCDGEGCWSKGSEPKAEAEAEVEVEVEVEVRL
jgi:hypothetical protein